VVERRQIEYCLQCASHWNDGLERPKCADNSHDHQRVELHRHLDAVVFPDNLTVIAASFDSVNPYERERPPDYGLYFDPRWRPPWDHGHLDWPDFGLPADARGMSSDLTLVRDRARAGQLIEIGCMGGHGRTGTALACLAHLSGVQRQEAVSWVKDHYCSSAVESPEQAAFVASLVFDKWVAPNAGYSWRPLPIQ
jgi:hypothetical protein